MARIAGLVVGLAGLASPAFAQDGTWLANPTVTSPDGNFNYFANATPAAVPGGTGMEFGAR